MPAGLGYKSWGSLLREATYGTDPGGARGGYFRVVSDGIKLDKSYYVAPGLGQRGVRGVLEGVNVLRGPIEVESNFEGGWLGFVKGLFGGYAFTLNSPVASVNRHVFTCNDNNFWSYAMELSRGYVGAAGPGSTKVFLYKGTVANTAEFRVAQDSLLGLGLEVIGQTETTDVTQFAAPTYPAELPIKNVYYNPSYTPSLAIAVGSTIATLQSATIRYDNKLGLRPNLSSLTAQPLPTDRREIRVELVADFEDTVHYDKFKNETEGAFSLYLTGPIITGATRYDVLFDATVSHMTGDTPPIEGPQYMRYTINLWLVKNVPEMSMTVHNAQADMTTLL